MNVLFRCAAVAGAVGLAVVTAAPARAEEVKVAYPNCFPIPRFRRNRACYFKEQED